MNRKITTALAHLTAAAVVAIVGPAPTPTTATTAATAPSNAAASGSHCAVLVDTAKMACASTLEAARRALGPKAEYLVAELWKDADFRGDYLPYYKSKPCTTTFDDRDIPAPVVPSGWNDQLSSARTDTTTPNTHCSLIIWEHGHFDGERKRVEDEKYVGASWNDRASSWYIT